VVRDRSLAALSVAPFVTDESPEPDVRTPLLGGGFLYAVMLGSGLAWLWARGRGDELSRLAIGEHGPAGRGACRTWRT
jgi:hypothetical protein